RAAILRPLPAPHLPRAGRGARAPRRGARGRRPAGTRVRASRHRLRRTGAKPPRHRRANAGMAKLIVISWRDVPSQVVVRQGRDTVRVQLSARFQEAVDRAAMRAGKGKSDAYIADWKRGEPRECGNDMKAEAIAEIARLEAQYTDADLERLIR